MIVLWHAYSLPQITMETLSAEAALDAMVLTYGAAYIPGSDAETVYLKQIPANEESKQSEAELD